LAAFDISGYGEAANRAGGLFQSAMPLCALFRLALIAHLAGIDRGGVDAFAARAAVGILGALAAKGHGLARPGGDGNGKGGADGGGAQGKAQCLAAAGMVFLHMGAGGEGSDVGEPKRAEAQRGKPGERGENGGKRGPDGKGEHGAGGQRGDQRLAHAGGAAAKAFAKITPCSGNEF